DRLREIGIQRDERQPGHQNQRRRPLRGDREFALSLEPYRASQQGRAARGVVLHAVIYLSVDLYKLVLIRYGRHGGAHSAVRKTFIGLRLFTLYWRGYARTPHP